METYRDLPTLKKPDMSPCRAWPVRRDNITGAYQSHAGLPRWSNRTCTGHLKRSPRSECRSLPLLADSSQLGCGVEGIAAWWAAQPRWWVEFWNTGDHLDSPVGMVEESVVAAAQRHAVADAGRPIIGPMDHVMDFAPAGGY